MSPTSLVPGAVAVKSRFTWSAMAGVAAAPEMVVTL
jgi:hypothetical protein